MLCITPSATAHTSSMQQPRKSKPFQLCVKDIYGVIEVERLKSRQACHERVIRALTTAGSEGSQLSGAEGLSLPSLSRPTTAVSRPQTNLSHAGSTAYPRSEIIQGGATISEFGDMPSQRSILRGHSAPIIPGRGPCVRAKSAVEREMQGAVNCLSRQCCDVLGPRICHECNQINRRNDGNYRYEAHYPNLHVSEENFSTTVLASKRYPKLTKYQVSNKVARGEISRPSLRQAFERRKAQREEDEREASSRLDSSRSFVPPALTFFTNIRDLNEKIISGKVSKNLRQGEDPAKKPTHTKLSESQREELQTFTEKLCPTFISAKKVKWGKKPSFIMYYEPPLLPKVCQNVEPAFFAGGDHTYQLPERLPDKLYPDEDEVSRPGSAMTSTIDES